MSQLAKSPSLQETSTKEAAVRVPLSWQVPLKE